MFILLHFYLILGPVCPVLSQDLRAVTLFPLYLGEVLGVVHVLPQDPCSGQGTWWWEGRKAEEQALKRL